MILQNIYTDLANYIKKHRWFIALLILVGIFRLYLAMSGGHLYWPDELRYKKVVKVIENLYDENRREALSCLFSAKARPGYVLFSLIPATVQGVIYQKGIIKPSNPHFFDITSIFNVCISLLISVLFYHISLLLLKNPWPALLGTAVYSLLCNTNLYIRHLFPYDYSLFLYLIGLFMLLKAGAAFRLKKKTVIISGLISALAFLTYPGYYLFVIVLASLIYTLTEDKIRLTILHLLSAGGMIVLWEMIARLSGESYIWNLLHFGEKYQGSYEEGYIFAWRYLSTVEGPIGYAIFILFLIYVIFLLPRSFTKPVVKVMFLSIILAYLIYGTLSVVFHRMVFQGRILHMYIPFLVWGAMLTLNHIQKRNLLVSASLLIAGLSLISFVNWSFQYIQLWYPRDLVFKYISHVTPENILKVKELTKNEEADFKRYPVVTINAMHLLPISEVDFPLSLSSNMLLIKSVSHPLNFQAYHFEGFSILERKRLRDRKYQMRIYTRSSKQ